MAQRTELDQLVYTTAMDVNGLSKDSKAAVDLLRRMANQMGIEAEKGGREAGKRIGHGIQAGLNRNQMMELAHVGRSIADGLAAGQNPVRILAMEGGRLAEVLGMGGHGMGGALSALPALLNPVTIGLAALAVVVMGCAAAELAYEDSHRKLLIALMGTGAASGLTVDGLNKVAEATARVNLISIAAARDAAVSFASIGHVTEANMGPALAVLRDYSVLMGEKVPDAAKELAHAFADPAKGAEDLNSKLYFLNEGQMETIRHMSETGDRAGALKVLIDALSGATDGAASHMSGLDKIVQGLGKSFSDAFDDLGKWTYGLAHADVAGRTVDQMKALRAQLAAEMKANPLSGISIQPRISDLDNAIAAATKEANRSAEAQTNLHVADLTKIAESVDTKFLKIKRDEAAIEAIDKEQRHPTVDPITHARTDSKGFQVGYTDAELAELMAGAKARLARDQHGEMRTPKGPKAPADKSDQALSEARKARDQALAAIQEDVLEKAKLEKDAIDDGLKAQIDALNARKDIGSVERAQAKALDEQTAEIRKATIDAKAQNDVEKEALRNRRERDDIEIQLLNTQAQMAPTLKQRQALELEALRRRKVLEDAQRANELDAKRRLATAADKFNGTVTTVLDNGAQKAADSAYAADVAKIKAQGPLADYIRGIRDLDTEMENAEVRGLQGLTDGLAQLVVTGGKLGNVLHKVIQDLEYDLAKIGIQKLEQVGLKLLGFDGGGYTGDGARSGGVDGKGGFMAILHPRESVIDHTRGNPSARSASAVMVASPAPYFDLRGAVMTQDLVNQMNQISANHARDAVKEAVSQTLGSQQGYAALQEWERG